MLKLKPNSRTVSPAIEALESRIALSATPLSIGRALDLPSGTEVVLHGDAASFATMLLGATGQLLGFPSGGDGDFLILSTGVASQITTLGNTGGSQGTDLGPVGSVGDTASVNFTLQVPTGSADQRLKLDFMFLTEEFPEFLHAGFNDTFSIKINGTNYAVDELGSLVEVDNVYFTGEAAPGTFFDGRTSKLTLSYAVPAGTTTLDVELSIADVGDGTYDSAALVDNVRFETPQTVYLDFGGSTVKNQFGPGINTPLPAFTAADLGSSSDTAALIADITAKLESKFSLYDILFTTTQPGAGDFTTLHIGGSDALLLDISGASPLVKSHFPAGSPTINDFLGLNGESLLGLAGAPDVGNRNHNDQAIVFSGELGAFYSSATPEEKLDHLVVTLAHELGHNLGLRHLTDTALNDIMKQSDPRDVGVVFGSTLAALAEHWTDGTTDQNDEAYLTSILGKQSGSGLAPASGSGSGDANPTPTKTLYDVTITIGTGDVDAAPVQLHFAKLDGSQNIALPILTGGAVITLSGASKLGGVIDIFSGKATGGVLTDTASAVPLYDANDHLKSIPLTKITNGKTASFGTLPLKLNQLGDVSVLSKKVGTFTDSDGDIYTVKLTGPGQLGYVLDDLDHDGKGGLARLSVDGTSVGASTLSITVKKAKTGDGRVDIGAITGSFGAGLKSIAAPAVDITGNGVNFSSALASVSLHDLKNGAHLFGGVGSGVKTSVRLRDVQSGSDIAFGTDVAFFQAVQFADSTLHAPSLAKMVVTTSLAGQLHITGRIGSLTTGDLLGTAMVDGGGSAFDSTALAFHEVMNGATVALAGTITTLKAAKIGDARITAESFGSIAITGDFAGDLLADGKLGLLTAHDILSGASITAGGLPSDVTTLKLHQVEAGVSITLGSTIAKLTAAKIGDATIAAAAIGSLLVTGDFKAALVGDFDADLTLSGGLSSFQNNITTAVIQGRIHDATLRLDGIGSFTAYAFINSTLFAGYTPADEAQPMLGGAFLDSGTIKSFTLKDTHAAFSDSILAAKNIGTLSLASVTTSNGGDAFGILTHAAPGKVTIPGFLYDKTLADNQAADFHILVA